LYSLIPNNKPSAPVAGKRTDKVLINIGCSTALIVMFLVTAILASVYHAGTGASYASTRAVDRSDACFMSQKFVKENLKAPTTAEFPDWTEDNCRVSQSAGVWIVTSFVDSQNGFGAMIRSDYVAQMSYNPTKDTWALTNLSIDSR
jgi:hypothetical protein